jgi:hypothetical protein
MKEKLASKIVRLIWATRPFTRGYYCNDPFRVYNERSIEIEVMSDLQTIPGVGEKIELLLNDAGVRSIKDMKTADPEQLYDNLCDQKASRVDRCVLYVFRFAKYYVTHKNHNPEKLKWSNWKD